MNVALTDRSIINVTGADAKSFLQNIMTNDIEKVTEKTLVYSCLLTPQGQVLNDFFVLPGIDQGSYWIDIETAQRDSFLRRLGFFKLRARVALTALDDIHISASLEEAADRSFKDPRHPEIGFRIYVNNSAEPLYLYENHLISLGIPDGSKTIKLEKDVSADVNLDLLNAIAWDKGCFIGQEVAARMYHRDLNKKRLLICKNAEGLAAGQVFKQEATEWGEVRQKSHDGSLALIQVKMGFLPNTIEGVYTVESEAGQLLLVTPDYLSQKASSK